MLEPHYTLFGDLAIPFACHLVLIALNNYADSFMYRTAPAHIIPSCT